MQKTIRPINNNVDGDVRVKTNNCACSNFLPALNNPTILKPHMPMGKAVHPLFLD